MKLKFYKYQGCGNDFIMLLDHPPTENLSENTIKRLCDRHFGIGADGLIRIVPEENYDFRMIYYNSDGRESSMCGNGGRCAVLFARDQKLIDDEAKFLAIDGEHHGWITPSGAGVSLNVSENMIQRGEDEYFADTGSPHIVRFVSEIEKVDVVEFGKRIRYADEFKEKGVNVNAVEILDENLLFVRTYERGVENETLSCGTGVTAAAWVYAHIQGKDGNTKKVSVVTLGGNFEVIIEETEGITPVVRLFGDAAKVFEGEVEI